MKPPAAFPGYRPRRLRRTPLLRELVRETRLSPRQLVAPLFVTWGSRRREPIPSMPGVYRLSISEAATEGKELMKRGIGAILLFGIPA
ncbi:MAG: porphobilinogen synthase, partial [Candidatus Omnitrophica bacterium]|nr:porphobilinogen synthase [Candidatus Omnitrophota bacterium]